MSLTPKTYRVYRFDLLRKDVSVDFINAANDEEAIVKAEANCLASKCEIWDGKRLVTQIDHQRC